MPVQPSDAGQAVLCLACGWSFRAPADLGVGTSSLEDVPSPAPTDAAVPPDVVGEPHVGVDAADEDDDLIPGFPPPDAPAPSPTPTSSPTSAASAETPACTPASSWTSSKPSPTARPGHHAWLGWAAAVGVGVAWLGTTLYDGATRRAETEAAGPVPGVEARSASVAPADVAEPADAHLGTELGRPATSASPDTGAEIAFAPQLPQTRPAGVADAPTEREAAAAAEVGGEGHVGQAPPGATAAVPPDRSPPGGGEVPPEASPPQPPPSTTQAAGAPIRVVRGRRGFLRPVAPPDDEVSDERIERAIRRGVDYLASRYDPKTHSLGDRDGGVSTLATYALIQCSLTIDDPRLDPAGELMDKLVERMNSYPSNPGVDTYQRGVRATALALLNRPKDRVQLEENVGALLHGQTGGRHGYHAAVPEGSSGFRFDPARAGTWDNSNSQYGLLGVWAGAEAGVQVPAKYWAAVDKHWSRTEIGDSGTWGYRAGGPARVAMTAAGTASLLVTNDFLGRGVAECGRDPYPGALGRALAWFEQDDSWLALPSKSGLPGYTLYGIERVGLASGFKFFGPHDWYRELARRTLNAQRDNGAWEGRGTPIETSYRLLFLARGRPPVMMNKLRFEGAWANHPRDAANLALFAARSMERPLNAQVVRLDNAWHDWMDAPVLFIASHEPPSFTAADEAKLRHFARAGGLIFTQADCEDPRFNRFAEALVKRLFPEYEFADLPADHPIYHLVNKVTPRPRLRAVSNGSRILVLHSPADLGRHWHLRDEQAQAAAFGLGLNLFVYATGKRDLRNRVDSPYVPPVTKPAMTQIPVVRVKYAGTQWDPEPGAWPRFANLFERRTGTALEVAPVKWKDLAGSTAPLAHLSGTAKYDPTDAEVAAMKAYVESGGVLLVDTSGGTGAFASAMKDVLAKAFPGAVLDPVGPTHPMLNRGEPGMLDVSKPRYRPFTLPKQGKRPGLLGFTAGEGQVILTTLDITSGLLHTGTWGINGFDPVYCENLVQNLVFWAHDTAPESLVAAPARGDGE